MGRNDELIFSFNINNQTENPFNTSFNNESTEIQNKT